MPWEGGIAGVFDPLDEASAGNMRAPLKRTRQATSHDRRVVAGPFEVIERTGSDQDMGRRDSTPLGQRLIESGALDPGDLVRALALQSREDARLGTILVAHQMATREAILAAVAEQWNARAIDVIAQPPDTRLIDSWGVAACLADGILPWRRVGGCTVVATAYPERFVGLKAELEHRFGPVLMALAQEETIAQAVTQLRSRRMALAAETKVPAELSCRLPRHRVQQVGLPLLMGIGLVAAYFAPAFVLSALIGWAGLTLAALTGLRVYGVWLLLRRHREGDGATRGPPDTSLARLPVISVLIPLLREERVAERLLVRLGRLRYPRELMDILLVCEEDDSTTAAALAKTSLPSWVRVIPVPRGGVQTKPRALNYALDFCRGHIVGIWDAEDAPEPDQLTKVARGFASRGPDVACLQGALDYYNSRKNWLSRCFTVEYASWFRAFLPALQALNVPIPLGGTTLFFRRHALEDLGGWDAHNVTEDADLGVRLARAGFRTELLDTVTEEEANCRPLAWIKQRSRWLKGYGLTWAVHMRDPVALWRDLGPRGFWVVQVLFLGSLSQFVLAPVLWTCWAMTFGWWHPMADVLSPGLVLGLLGLFLFGELVSFTLALLGLTAAGKRGLWPWALTLPAYFPLAVVACYMGLWETLTAPFHWHKTSHGVADDTPDETDQ